MTARNPRERLALSRALRAATPRLICVRAPRSEGRVPSPCSNGRSGTGHTVVGWAHAREKHEVAVRRVGFGDE